MISATFDRMSNPFLKRMTCTTCSSNIIDNPSHFQCSSCCKSYSTERSVYCWTCRGCNESKCDTIDKPIGQTCVKCNQGYCFNCIKKNLKSEYNGICNRCIEVKEKEAKKEKMRSYSIDIMCNGCLDCFNLDLLGSCSKGGTWCHRDKKEACMDCLRFCSRTTCENVFCPKCTHLAPVDGQCTGWNQSKCEEVSRHENYIPRSAAVVCRKDTYRERFTKRLQQQREEKNENNKKRKE